MKYIIISGSSDIGTAIIDDLIRKNHEIVYTYNSKKVDKFKTSSIDDRVNLAILAK